VHSVAETSLQNGDGDRRTEIKTNTPKHRPARIGRPSRRKKKLKHPRKKEKNVKVSEDTLKEH
jgi:hypothetical protein